MRPIPVPIVRMFPLKETLRIPHPELRDGIFLTGIGLMLFWDLRACKFLESTMNSN